MGEEQGPVAPAPFGSWPSPITAAVLVERTVSLSSVAVDGGRLWWGERRPAEGGREVLVCDGNDVLPPGFSARSRVHEYGGRAYAVHAGTVVFSNDGDGRLWRLDRGGGGPQPLTPEDGTARFADPAVSPDGRWVVCVRERHGDTVDNDLVAVDMGGGAPVTLARGRDFYAAPRFRPDGGRLAWLAWDLPNMPWDGTELWTTTFDGAKWPAVGGTHRVAGGPRESISQPRWSPDGTLHWISDGSGWWNLHSEAAGPLAPTEAEFADPDWVFGQSTYTFLPDGRLVAAWSRRGLDSLGTVAEGRAVPLDLPFTAVSALQALGPSTVAAIAASATSAPAVVTVDVDTGSWQTIRSSREGAAPVPAGALSEPRPISFPSEGGRTAHAFYYPPRLEGYDGRADERPPLMVRSHGGPTSSAVPALNLEFQYWTSRGIAVVDVDYGGSSGYGRSYREELDGRWGIVDVEDCVAAARHLAEAGEVDGNRLLVRGSSAGGFTTLCALTFYPGAFAAGASYYGVADLETLAAETHKFESRYLDRLVGPYPGAKEVYRQRSPVHFADRITSPVILFQGLEDAVVPPSQAEVLVEALRANGVPFAYVTFEGEQHGFRRAETVMRAVEA
ncbi:MAG TPA: prolyl oligopeptidase family serine peptidase, partial [Acidimicrobiales bacterium]